MRGCVEGLSWAAGGNVVEDADQGGAVQGRARLAPNRCGRCPRGRGAAGDRADQGRLLPRWRLMSSTAPARRRRHAGVRGGVRPSAPAAAWRSRVPTGRLSILAECGPTRSWPLATGACTTFEPRWSRPSARYPGHAGAGRPDFYGFELWKPARRPSGSAAADRGRRLLVISGYPRLVPAGCAGSSTVDARHDVVVRVSRLRRWRPRPTRRPSRVPTDHHHPRPGAAPAAELAALYRSGGSSRPP